MNKAFALLGLAKKAGKTTCGTKQTKDCIRLGKAYLAIVAEDVSAGTKKSITDSCIHYGVPYYVYGTMDELGRAVGIEFCACVAATDIGFANGIEKRLREILMEVKIYDRTEST